MQNEYSLKVKLIVSFWLVLIFSLAVPSNYFIQSVEDEVDRQHLESVRERLRIIDWIISRQFEDLMSGEADTLLKSFDFLDEAEISILNQDGRIIAHSHLSRQEFDGHPSLVNMPEIVRARKEGTGYYLDSNGTNGQTMVHIAVKRDYPGNNGQYYLRISSPHSGMHPFFERISANLWKFVFLSLLLSCIVVYLMVTYLTYRFKPMIKMAKSMGEGNFKQRITESPGREFDPLVEAINRMARDIEKNMEIVSSQKAELETILNGIRDGLAALDTQGRIISFNRSFQDIFRHMDHIQGKRPLEVLLNNQLQKACDGVLGKSDQQTLTMEMEIKDRFYDVHVVAPRDRRTIGAIILLHDITALKRLENIRKDFVANASHELRTPLTSIKGYTETLLDNPKIMEQKGRDLLKVVLRNTDNMIRLLDDILQLSRIESAQDQVALEDVDLMSVVSRAWKNCKHYIQDREVSFETEMLETELVMVRGEGEYLGQVFQNLLENSIKFAPDRGVIRVLVRDHGEMVHIGVQDNGPGIPRSEQQRIFERFYRVKKDKNKVKGTGLGLAICRNIISVLGGEIWAESPVSGQDHGCIIWFSLYKSGA